MKGVLNMTMKKGIISISTIAVVILGVFLAVRFIGGRESASNVKLPDASIVQSENSIPIDNNEALTNGNEESNLNPSEVPKEVENTQVESTNEMDTAFINDKTSVGLYTVKKDDTVYSIVKTYMPSHEQSKIVEFIKSRNSIDESFKISEGQKIVIPYEKVDENSKAVVSQANMNEYTVQKQDTLTSIAKSSMPSYGIKQAIEMLKETNKIIDENAIKEGSLLSIPK
ncbi:MAG: LysM repeat protein [Clostridium sp.]|jgi:LysM repeat protein